MSKLHSTGSEKQIMRKTFYWKKFDLYNFLSLWREVVTNFDMKNLDRALKTARYASRRTFSILRTWVCSIWIGKSHANRFTCWRIDFSFVNHHDRKWNSLTIMNPDFFIWLLSFKCFHWKFFSNNCIQSMSVICSYHVWDAPPKILAQPRTYCNPQDWIVLSEQNMSQILNIVED